MLVASFHTCVSINYSDFLAIPLSGYQSSLSLRMTTPVCLTDTWILLTPVFALPLNLIWFTLASC